MAAPAPLRTSKTAPPKSNIGSGNALTQLQPTQVRTLREGFQILDRDSDGIVNRDDVADMLAQLGRTRTRSKH
jgi:Ca2+-binding EF-hand superfamily protein